MSEEKKHITLTDIALAPLGWMFALTARLPFGALYAIADAIYFLLAHVVHYREKVIKENITKCFPDKDEAWVGRTTREFYRCFADYVVETLKLKHVSNEEMKRRVVYRNIEEVDRLLGSGQSIVAYFSHCFNWEWAPAITLWTSLERDKQAVFAQVYRPLKNRWFDHWFLTLRSRFGSHSYQKSRVLRDLIMLRREQMPWMTGFMSDQKPSHGDPTLPLMFLNRPTAMITGTETLARKFKAAVVYMDIERLRRGYYQVTIRHITDDASLEAEHQVTRIYASMLAETIRRNPPIWLWSHRRWKIPVTLPENEQ